MAGAGDSRKSRQRTARPGGGRCEGREAGFAPGPKVQSRATAVLPAPWAREWAGAGTRWGSAPVAGPHFSLHESVLPNLPLWNAGTAESVQQSTHAQRLAGHEILPRFVMAETRMHKILAQQTAETDGGASETGPSGGAIPSGVKRIFEGETTGGAAGDDGGAAPGQPGGSADSSPPPETISPGKQSRTTAG